MSNIFRNKRHKTRLMQGWLLWFALTAAFSLIGAGMASWQHDMAIGGVIVTGNVEVAFSDYYGSRVITSTPEGWVGTDATAGINRLGPEELLITVGDAYPGLKAEFWYGVENTGTMPVKITANISSHDHITLNSASLPAVIPAGSSVSGELVIIVKNEGVTPESSYPIAVKFTVEPYY